MSDDLIFAAVSFLLYGGGFLALLYIGKKRPLMRLELVGVLFIIVSRVALYIAALLFYGGAIVAPSPEFLSWLSRLSSLMMGIIINIYLALAIIRINHNDK